jgi:hypothetical protein
MGNFLAFINTTIILNTEALEPCTFVQLGKFPKEIHRVALHINVDEFVVFVQRIK